VVVLYSTYKYKKVSFRFKKAELGVFNTKSSDLVLMGFRKDCRIMGLTRGEFSLIDLIRSVLKKTGKAHVITTTWSAGIKDVHQVDWMRDNDLISSFKLITDHSYANRQKKYAASIVDIFGIENIRTSEIHAKFTLIHNEDFNVCIRTSMNLNANKTCENFEIDEDKDVFDFYMNFIEHTFEDMPKGFTESSFKVNKSLDNFFNKNSKQIQGWSEV
jgi:hypothetical protein